MNAREAAEKNGKLAQLTTELEELFTKQNTRKNSDGVSIPATFLRVTVKVS